MFFFFHFLSCSRCSLFTQLIHVDTHTQVMSYWKNIYVCAVWWWHNQIEHDGQSEEEKCVKNAIGTADAFSMLHVSLSLSLSLSSLNEATDSPFYVCHTNCVVLCRIPFFLFSAELCINSHLSGSCVANRNVNLHIGWTHHPPAPYAYTLLLIIKCQADSNIGVQQVIYWN